MATDVWVEFVPREDPESGDGYAVRGVIAREIESVRIDGVKLCRVVEVGGGTDFHSGVCEAQFEGRNAQDAQVAAGVIAVALLKQGFTVRAGGPQDRLVARERGAVAVLEPGEAFVTVVAPLGT